MFLTAIAFAFLRQLLDPTSPAKQSCVPTGAPAHYAPPFPAYNSAYSNNNLGAYNPSAPPYVPPPGPPPGFASGGGGGGFGRPSEEGKPPGYVRGLEDPFGDGDAKDSKDQKGYGWGAEEGPSERDVTSRAGRNPFA